MNRVLAFVYSEIGTLPVWMVNNNPGRELRSVLLVAGYQAVLIAKCSKISDEGILGGNTA